MASELAPNFQHDADPRLLYTILHEADSNSSYGADDCPCTCDGERRDTYNGSSIGVFSNSDEVDIPGRTKCVNIDRFVGAH